MVNTTSTSIGQTHSRSPWNCPGLCGRGHGVPAEEWGPGLRWWTPRQSYWRPLCLRLLGRMEEAPFFEAKPPSPCSRRTYSCWDDEHLVHCWQIYSPHLLSGETSHLLYCCAIPFKVYAHWHNTNKLHLFLNQLSLFKWTYSEKWLLLHFLCVLLTRAQSFFRVPPQQLLMTNTKQLEIAITLQ